MTVADKNSLKKDRIIVRNFGTYITIFNPAF